MDEINKYNRHRNNALLFALALLVFTIIVVLIVDEQSKNTLIFLSWYSIISFFVSIAIWRYVSSKFITPVTIIIFCIYLFNLGQCVLWVSGAEHELNLLTSGEHSILDLILGTKFLLLCMQGFLLGTLLYRRRYFDRSIVRNTYFQEDVLRIVSIVVLVISIIPYVLTMAKMLVASLTYGYAYIYSSSYQDTTNSFLGVVADLFEPALLGLVVSQNKNHNKRRITIVIALATVVIRFIVGGRAGAVAMLLSLFLIFFFEDIKINRRQWIIFIICGVILLLIISAIQIVRSSSGRNIEDFFDALLENGFGLENIFAEFGWSMSASLYTMELVPLQYAFRFGTTYLWALLAVIPNIGIWDVHPAEKYASLTNWITKAANHEWSGVGYSSTAEAYINFSWAGVLILIIWGYILVKIIYDCKDKGNKSPIYLYIVLSSFLCLFYSFVRGDFRDMVRSFTWRILPIVLLYILLLNILRRRKNLDT